MMRDNLALVSWWVDYPPFSLTQARFWFSKIINWLGDVLEEYGIKLNAVNEYGTSRQCSICSMKHENGRVKRGLYVCPVTSIKINADLNAARNIAKRVGYNTSTPSEDTQLHSNNKRRETINPQRRGNNQNPQDQPYLPEVGRGSYQV
jgi:putative transposase